MIGVDDVDARPRFIQLIAFDPRRHDEQSKPGRSATTRVSSARWSSTTVIGPVHVLDDQYQPVRAGQMPDEGGDGISLAAIAGLVVHRVVERADIARLFQIQKIV